MFYNYLPVRNGYPLFIFITTHRLWLKIFCELDFHNFDKLFTILHIVYTIFLGIWFNIIYFNCLSFLFNT